MIKDQRRKRCFILFVEEKRWRILIFFASFLHRSYFEINLNRLSTNIARLNIAEKKTRTCQSFVLFCFVLFYQYISNTAETNPLSLNSEFSCYVSASVHTLSVASFSVSIAERSMICLHNKIR